MRKNRILVILLAILLLFVSSSCNILSNINFDDPADKSPIIVDPNEDNSDNDRPLDKDDGNKPGENKQDDKNQEIDKDGLFTSRDEVALYIYTYGHLPKNYVTKSTIGKNKHIRDYWTPQNKLSIGGDIFYNREGLLPEKPGRIYYEADINYKGGSNRGRERIVYSNDGLIFYTDDHYESFVKYNPEDKSWKSSWTD